MLSHCGSALAVYPASYLGQRLGHSSLRTGWLPRGLCHLVILAVCGCVVEVVRASRRLGRGLDNNPFASRERPILDRHSVAGRIALLVYL